jgi:hypothetical protein
MRTISIVCIALILTFAIGSAIAKEGPAPNASDGIPDGSGWSEDHWPEDGMGPAPNAGDGIPDGSGF